MNGESKRSVWGKMFCRILKVCLADNTMGRVTSDEKKISSPFPSKHIYHPFKLDFVYRLRTCCSSSFGQINRTLIGFHYNKIFQSLNYNNICLSLHILMIQFEKYDQVEYMGPTEAFPWLSCGNCSYNDFHVPRYSIRIPHSEQIHF